MSRQDFLDGFYYSVLQWAEFVSSRPIVVAELPQGLRTSLEARLNAFYTANETDIENSSGIPGLPKPKAWQVGFEFAAVMNRRRTIARSADWGVGLANRMTLTATQQRRLRVRRLANGSVVAEEVDG